MNTKGMKFLAVLAVLAMAFAAFAVMADTEQNSAAIPEEVTTVTTEPDFRAAVTGTEEFNVKLGANIVVSGTGYLIESAGVIDFNGYTITATGALNPVKLTQKIELPEKDDGRTSIIVNESSSLTLKDTSKDGKGGIVNAYGTTVANKANTAVLFNAPNGVMQVDSGRYTVDNGTIKYKEDDVKRQDINNYWYTVKNLGTMTINGGYFAGMNHFWGDGATAASGLIVNGWWDPAKTTAEMTINGGTFEYGLNTIKGDCSSEITVNGGEFKNPLQYSVVNWDSITINAVTLEGAYTGLSNRANTDYPKDMEGSMQINCDLTIPGVTENRAGAEMIVNGTIETAADITNKGIIGGNGQIITSGDLYGLEGDKDTETFNIAGTVTLKVLEGAYIPAYVIFGYKDEYHDVHSFMTNKGLEVGMDDFTITAGQNKIIVDGTVTINASTTYTFNGNATLSGMVYVDPAATAAVTLTLENITKELKSNVDMPADIKLGTFQVTDGGNVELKTSALVEAGCGFYIAGDLTIDDGAILKIAEGSVVKPEGTLKITAPTAGSSTANPPVEATNGGSIWNAGQFIATSYNDGAFDAQLIRVFMNTSYPTGTFYQGSSVYDGTVPTTDTAGQSPLTVAFGAYIDMTGIDKVNLTSGGIDVNSGLYKYKTLILATFNNTIALTATYDNQYPVTVTLDGKSSATPVYTAKSATFRNVVWESPISATLYVVAPELYTVVLAKAIDQDDHDKWVVDTTSTDPVWTKDLTIKDQNGRVIPISTEGETAGQIKVVFGYEYTIEGATSTSNYKFYSPNGELTDLTKVSKTKATFTMIRNNTYYPEPEEPVVLYITEGYATELTVYLDDGDKKYSVGDVFMYYNIENDAGEVVGDGTPVTLQLDKDDKKVGVIKGIYSNDVIYFKSEFVKYYRSVAVAQGAKNIDFPFHMDTTDPTKKVYEDVTLDSEEFEQEFTFSTVTKTDNKASFTLRCELDYVPVTFEFGAETDANQSITVDFTEYCSKATHKETEVTYKKDVEPTPIDPQNPDAGSVYVFTINMVVGEVYNVTWTERNGYLSTMQFIDRSVEEPAYEIYAYGTAVTVEGALEYVLSEEKLLYITVENQTNYDLTLSIGKFSSDIPAKGSNDKVIVNQINNTLILSKKGWTVEGWDFAYYKGATTPVDTIYVSGPQTTQTFSYYNGEGTTEQPINITKIVILQSAMEKTRYFVNVLADDHGAIDPFDQTGYMGEVRKAYVTTQYGYNVVDVLYEYQEVDMTEKAVGHATKGTTPEGAEVWTYTMPASNVLLKPVIEKETRDLSFVDQTGELIEPAQKVAPRTEVNMPVPCKPLSEIVSVTTESQIDYVYDPVTGYISFVMPDEDVVFIVTCKEIDYSKKLSVTIGQTGNAIDVVLFAVDGLEIAPGTVTIEVWYTYLDEEGDIMTESVEVPLTYDVEGKTAYLISDTTFIQELGDNYGGAFAVTGTFTLGAVQGEMVRTAYTPVEA